MIECPVDFSKLQPGTTETVEALAQVADNALSSYFEDCRDAVTRVTKVALPVVIDVTTKYSKICLAKFCVEADGSGFGMTLLSINEDELYREGRAKEEVVTTFKVEAVNEVFVLVAPPAPEALIEFACSCPSCGKAVIACVEPNSEYAKKFEATLPENRKSLCRQCADEGHQGEETLSHLLSN